MEDICADPNPEFLKQRSHLVQLVDRGTLVIPPDWSPEPSQMLVSHLNLVVFMLKSTAFVVSHFALRPLDVI